MSLTWPVYNLGVIDSTNTEAKRRAKAGGFADCWLVAEAQTAGRGRLERGWVSPAGNLYSSALFREPGGFAVASRIPFAAALAVSDMVERLLPGVPARLKWPNDVRVEGAKVSGILIETGKDRNGLWVCAGIGVNVVSSPESVGQAATSLAALASGAVPSADIVLAALRETFAARLAHAREGFEIIRRDWLKVAEGLGQTVRVSPGGTVMEGVFEDMGPDGALILRLPDGSQQTIRAGDVELIRKG